MNVLPDRRNPNLPSLAQQLEGEGYGEAAAIVRAFIGGGLVHTVNELKSAPVTGFTVYYGLFGGYQRLLKIIFKQGGVNLEVVMTEELWANLAAKMPRVLKSAGGQG